MFGEGLQTPPGIRPAVKNRYQNEDFFHARIRLMIPFFLSFSDSAKYAEAAKNLVSGQGWIIHHSFFDPKLASNLSFPAHFPPLTSWYLSLVFRILPPTDSTVAFAGYFLLLIISILIYFIAKKLHSGLAGFLSVLFFLGNLFFYEYAANSASEITLSLEIVLTVFLYLYLPRFKWLSLAPVALMFLTRPQAAVFVVSLVVFFWAFSRRKLQNFLVIGLLFIFSLIFSSRYPGSAFSPYNYLGSIHMASDLSPGGYLRGAVFVPISTANLITKSFYNLYNFFKAPERLVNPILIPIFLYGLLFVTKQKYLHRFYYFTVQSVLLFIVAASLTLPNARYIHPVLPLFFVGAAIALIEMSKKLHFPKLFILAVLFFVLLPTVGHFTLDARFRRRQFNTNLPPVYKVISDIMAQNIPQGKLIITNLDTWASWYHGLTTMWFPLNPDMLAASPPEYIVLTNYLANDADFALGPWKQILDQPDNSENQFIKNNYFLLDSFTIQPSQSYENLEIKGVIFQRRPRKI